MKKFLSVLMAGAMLFGVLTLAGCGDTTTVTEGVRLYDPLTGRHWMLGDAIKIKVTAADVPLGRIDFDFIPM